MTHFSLENLNIVTVYAVKYIKKTTTIYSVIDVPNLRIACIEKSFLKIIYANLVCMFQAVDGQHLILHPINLKCLLHHYGSYDRLPHRFRSILTVSVYWLEEKYVAYWFENTLCFWMLSDIMIPDLHR